MSVLIEELSTTNDENNQIDEKNIKSSINSLEVNNFNIEPVAFNDKTNQIAEPKSESTIISETNQSANELKQCEESTKKSTYTSCVR